MPKVSVIVPVYNVENYIEKCIQSIQNQSLPEFECLIIDDASPDNSTARIKPLIENDARFRILRHKRNQGLGPTRNTGIDHATAEYICFIDSDDYVEPDYLKLLYNAITHSNTDIVKCARYNVLINNERVIKSDPGSQTWFESVKNKLLGIESCSVFTRMYKKKIFEKVRFPRGIYEDDGTLFRLVVENKIEPILSMPIPLYNYLAYRAGSIMNSALTPRKLYYFVHNILKVHCDCVMNNALLRSQLQDCLQIKIFVNFMTEITRIYIYSKCFNRDLKFFIRLVNKSVPKRHFKRILYAVFKKNRIYKFYVYKHMIIHFIVYILTFKLGYIGICIAQFFFSAYLLPKKFRRLI